MRVALIAMIAAVVSGRVWAQEGFPTAAETQQAYDQADLNRAVQAYKFFYPTVTGAAIIKGNESVGLVTNKVFGIMDSNPKQIVFTTNSDTPYGPLQLDLSIGPIVVELPPGPLIVCSIDINQRWVADMGLPGPNAGRGGKHILVPPGFKGELPKSGYYVHPASSNRQIVGVRSLPVNGDVAGAKTRISTVKIYPLDPATPWQEPQWLDVTDKVKVGADCMYAELFMSACKSIRSAEFQTAIPPTHLRGGDQGPRRAELNCYELRSTELSELPKICDARREDTA